MTTRIHYKMKLKFKSDIYLGSIYQLAIVFLFFWLSRFVFIFCNSELINLKGFGKALEVAVAGIRIDACILAYATIPFVLMRFAPWPWVMRKGWISVSNLLLYIVNSLLLILNLGDTAYFPFTGYRMTWQGFVNVATDPGTPSLLLSFLTQFWWAYLLGILFVTAMIWCASRVRLTAPLTRIVSRKIYWIARSVIFLLMGLFVFGCIRGWTGFHDRPIERATGFTLVDDPLHFSAVLNTPFSIAYSIGKEATVERYDFFTSEQLNELRNDLRMPSGNLPNRRNLFLIIIESGGSVLSNVFNPVEGDRKYSDALTFVDSLAKHSLINRNLYASGRMSTQSITHIFEGIPFFGESYFVESPYVDNIVDTPARLLGETGYDTRFYYGCTKGNYHVDETARVSGFKTIRTRESYGDDRDFDGKWGIFDRPMADYIIGDITKSYKKDTPFFASWFTITAHNPFNLPKGTDLSGYHYKKESAEQAMEYTDKAIRRFFQLARKQPWYDNTIFIITSDHGQRDLGSFYSDNVYCHHHIPLLIYTPDGSIAPGVIDSIPMSQIDFAPTILDLAGYDKPYISLGVSMFDADAQHYGLADSFGSFYIVGDRYMIAVNSVRGEISKVFDINEKPYPRTHVSDYDKAATDDMLRWFRALMQDYGDRMTSDRLHAGK